MAYYYKWNVEILRLFDKLRAQYTNHGVLFFAEHLPGQKRILIGFPYSTVAGVLERLNIRTQHQQRRDAFFENTNSGERKLPFRICFGTMGQVEKI